MRNKESSYVLPNSINKDIKDTTKDDHDVRRGKAKLDIEEIENIRNKTPIKERKLPPMMNIKDDRFSCNYEWIDLSSKNHSLNVFWWFCFYFER